MLKNVLKMSRWFLFFITIDLITVATCLVDLYIFGSDDYNSAFLVSGTIEAAKGSNLTLTCSVLTEYVEPHSDFELIWAKRSKALRSKNESDLIDMAQQGSLNLYDLVRSNVPRYKNRATLKFTPVKSSDQGLYFCTYMKLMLFKFVHIKVTEKKPHSSVTCKRDKFRCVESGHCINLHYKCDGKHDCLDGSDEHFFICGEDPCRDKIHCLDGRCIPTSWCCNKLTDDDCNVDVRPSCCPQLIDPYDPTHWYNNQTTIRDANKSNGSRYLFISICVISAILSFVLFLFVISKLCGFDKNPNRLRNSGSDSMRNQTTCFSNFNTCEHSECAIRREFNPNIGCLYRIDTNNIQNSSSNNSELVDPLMGIRGHSPLEVADQPPPYEEVVTIPPNLDKSLMKNLMIDAPPPPYCSTNFFRETERENGNNLNASNHVIGVSNNNQSIGCDINVTSDRNNRE